MYPQGLLNYDKQRSIYTVFDMLYRSLKEHQPSSASILDFLAILGSWKIPMSLLDHFPLHRIISSNYADGATGDPGIADGDHALIHLFMLRLADVCLIKIRRNEGLSCQSFSVHKAICDWCIQRAASERPEWLKNGILQAAHGLAISIVEINERCVARSSLMHSSYAEHILFGIAFCRRYFFLQSYATKNVITLLSPEAQLLR